MSRHGRPSAAGGGGFGGGGGGGANTVTYGLNCSVVADVSPIIAAELESFGKRAQANVENIDDKTIAAWKKNVVDIADSYARVQEELRQAKQLVQSTDAFEALMLSSGCFTDLNNIDIKAGEKLVNEMISTNLSKFDGDKDPLKEKINGIFKLNTNKRAAPDDLEVIEQEATENDFKCPISLTLMLEPMKHAGCMHHINKPSLLGQLLSKQPTHKCPVVGCNAQWSKGDASMIIDTAFLYKVKAWQKRSERQKQSKNDDEEMEAL